MLYYIIGVIANEKCPPLFQDLFQKKHGFVLLNVPLTNYMSYLVYYLNATLRNNIIIRGIGLMQEV